MKHWKIAKTFSILFIKIWNVDSLNGTPNEALEQIEDSSNDKPKDASNN